MRKQLHKRKIDTTKVVLLTLKSVYCKFAKEPNRAQRDVKRMLEEAAVTDNERSREESSLKSDAAQHAPSNLPTVHEQVRKGFRQTSSCRAQLCLGQLGRRHDSGSDRQTMSPCDTSSDIQDFELCWDQYDTNAIQR